jgi:hypothetical protein
MPFIEASLHERPRMERGWNTDGAAVTRKTTAVEAERPICFRGEKALSRRIAIPESAFHPR